MPIPIRKTPNEWPVSLAAAKAINAIHLGLLPPPVPRDEWTSRIQAEAKLDNNSKPVLPTLVARIEELLVQLVSKGRESQHACGNETVREHPVCPTDRDRLTHFAGREFKRLVSKAGEWRCYDLCGIGVRILLLERKLLRICGAMTPSKSIPSIDTLLQCDQN